MKTFEFEVDVKLEGITEKDRPPQAFVYAFDSRGQPLTSAPVVEGKASLSLPYEIEGRAVRLFVGPRSEKAEPVKLSSLSRNRAYEKRLRVDPKKPRAEIKILDLDWRRWAMCSCVVRGRVVKRLTAPDGTVMELPICHARVTICEVDSIPLIIQRLPDEHLFRLRDELIDIVQGPIPLPPDPRPPDPFPPGPSPQPWPGPDPSPEARMMSERMSFARRDPERPMEPSAKRAGLRQFDADAQKRISAIASTTSTVELRLQFIRMADVIRYFLCDYFRWLYPYYRVDCFRTVGVDENGRFETTIHYSCLDDKPDLYFRVEQLQGGVWQTIYKPSVRCNTYWNYECGSEVVINVTDPSAIPCVPEDPVDLPAGVSTWVMPYAVGNTRIWGTPPGAAPAPAPAGWVKSDGLTDYVVDDGDFVDAPFGGRLGFRLGHSNNIPDGIKYYRWSYRKDGTSTWSSMYEDVGRHYVKESPGKLPSFPVYSLGPRTVGNSPYLFEFKPPAPPGPGPGDPPDTTTYWPTDDFFADIYSGFLSTHALPPGIPGAAGRYQIKLEVFDSAGTQVVPAAATFRFVVPTGVGVDGTILTREAAPAELDAGGFVFSLHIDNNPCSALIHAPNIGATSVADVCGFLRYDPASPSPVTISFNASHPNHFAEFSFRIKRGAITVPQAGVSGQEVAATAAGPYAGDGVGNFTNDFARGTLLSSCTNAAFAEILNVYAKATTGWRNRISSYDASNVRAFALAPEED